MREIKFSLIVVITCVIFSCDSQNANNQHKNKEEVVTIKDSIITAKDSVIDEKLDLSKYDRSINDISLWLAGMSQDSLGKYKILEKSVVWQTYHNEMNLAFEKLRTNRIPVLETFREQELVEANQDIRTLFYPYSGPDYPHARIFFPQADTIIMAGLEKVGDIPDFSKFTDAQLKLYFSNIVKSLNDILKWGYFITKKMKEEYAGEAEDKVNGVMPIFFVFLTQFECQVLEIKRFNLDKEGQIVAIKDTVVYKDSPLDKVVNGMQINYIEKGSEKVKTIYYFSHDLDEYMHGYTHEFIKFMNKQDVNVTYMKAASYLNIWFGIVRNYILDNSDYIFQDDSGIPIKYIDTKKWDIRLFGAYTKTLDMFKKYYQDSLKTMYAESKTVKKLNFGIGYNGTIGEANLQIFVKKK